MSEWNALNVMPPYDLVEVMDEEGAIGRAFPTYYPFKMVDGKFVSCEPYWDGGWIIEMGELMGDTKRIIRWRIIRI